MMVLPEAHKVFWGLASSLKPRRHLVLWAWGLGLGLGGSGFRFGGLGFRVLQLLDTSYPQEPAANHDKLHLGCSMLKDVL